MCNWMIVPQEQTVKGETFEVDVKNVSWRPASEKEKAAGSGDFKRLGTPTFRILFKHIKGDAPFKVVAQLKNGGWRVNLHEPDRLVPKEIRTNRVTAVTLRCPSGEMKVEKRSSGTMPYDAFFNRFFPERIRDAAFRILIQGLLDNAISEREQALAEAA